MGKVIDITSRLLKQKEAREELKRLDKLKDSLDQLRSRMRESKELEEKGKR